MIYLMYTVHTLICLFLIVVVLLQSGKGADLSVFGGGSTQTAFGATGTTSLLHKLTVSFFVAFMVTTIAIAMMESGGGASSVMTDVETEATAEDAATAADEVPAEATETEDVEGEATDEGDAGTIEDGAGDSATGDTATGADSADPGAADGSTSEGGDIPASGN